MLGRRRNTDESGGVADRCGHVAASRIEDDRGEGQHKENCEDCKSYKEEEEAEKVQYVPAWHFAATREDDHCKQIKSD